MYRCVALQMIRDGIGLDADIEKIEADIIERDHRDMTRELNPLTQAADAVLVDGAAGASAGTVDKALVAEAFNAVVGMYDATVDEINRHPQDFDIFKQNATRTVCNPDIVIKDTDNPGTIFILSIRLS